MRPDRRIEVLNLASTLLDLRKKSNMYYNGLEFGSFLLDIPGENIKEARVFISKGVIKEIEIHYYDQSVETIRPEREVTA